MPSAADMLRDGIRLCKAGEKRLAAQSLCAVVEQQPENELAWMWLSDCAETEEERQACLRRVLQINPRNLLVRDYLENTQPARRGADDYARQYERSARALAQDPSQAVDWLEKGFAAAMLSSATHNRVPELAECLNRCLACPPRAGLPARKAAALLDPPQRDSILECLGEVEGHLKTLAEQSPAGMSSIYQTERVRLADWACLLYPAGDPYPLVHLRQVVEDSFQHILRSICATTRGPRARQELIHNYRRLLLAQLSHSGLSQDRPLRDLLDRMIEAAA